MKNLILVVFVFLGTATFAQEACDDLTNVAKKHLAPSSDNPSLFVSDGQVYRALVDADQEAEFEATFYGGSIYRIAATAGSKENYVIFEIKDVDGNILFSNEDQANSPYWDFNVQSTMDVRIVLRMDIDKKDSGCITMLIGFAQ